MKSIHLIIFAALLLLPTSRPAAAQATRPADGLMPADALAAHREGRIADFAKAAETALQAELARPKLDEPAVVRLAALRAFAVRMGSVKPAGPEEAEAIEWAVAHPTIGPLLLLALTERDDASRGLAVMTALRKEFGPATVEQFAELAVATCVVWDSPASEGQTPAQAVRGACDVFGHLTRNRKSMRLDPQALPWQVLLYLVDSRVSPEERRWATSTFKLPVPPGRAYFTVRYDMAGFTSGQWRGADRQPYTLPNIQRLGGVCKDQAYFTVEVCRANGIPATVCTGQSGSGDGFHAWVGILGMNQKAAVFDFQTARYPEHGFFTGTVLDPQTGQRSTDGEAAMVAEWCASKPAARLMSQALTASLDLVEQTKRLELCKQAIEGAPGNQAAWAALVGECTKPDAPPTAIGEVAGVVERFAVGRYDNFAFKTFTKLIASRRPDEQLVLLDRAGKMFPRRPDLLAELGLLRGDLFRANARPVDALKIYDSLLTRSGYGPNMLDAMDRVDAMLKAAGKKRDLLSRYQSTWANMPAPQPSGYAWTTPWFLMGDRYARALDENGDKPGAERVRGTLKRVDLSKGK